MRSLRVVPALPVEALTAAVREALDGSGDAVLPVEPGAAIEGLDGARVPLPVAAVVRTSGSSGVPKQVVLSARALLGSAAATESALGGPGEWVLALPGHYVAGLQVVVRSIVADAEPHPVAPGPFTAAAFAAAVRGLPAHRRRYSALVPTQLHRLVAAIEGGDRAVGEAVRSLDAILIGGGRLEPASISPRRETCWGCT